MFPQSVTQGASSIGCKLILWEKGFCGQFHLENIGLKSVKIGFLDAGLLRSCWWYTPLGERVCSISCTYVTPVPLPQASWGVTCSEHTLGKRFLSKDRFLKWDSGYCREMPFIRGVCKRIERAVLWGRKMLSFLSSTSYVLSIIPGSRNEVYSLPWGSTQIKCGVLRTSQLGVLSTKGLNWSGVDRKEATDLLIW